MNKIAIVTDTNSGITSEQAEGLGVYVIAMPFTIENEMFHEGIDLSKEEFYTRMASDANISTSQPSPHDVLSLWDQLLQENDSVIYIPMSSGLSGSCQTAKMLSADYEGKVFVVDNQRISVTQRQSVLDAIKLRECGKSVQEIVDELMRTKLDASIYIMLDTLYYLKKGGRITPAAAALGTVLRLKPVLQIQGDKLDEFAKARTINQAKTIMIAAIKNDIIKRFGGLDGDQKVWLHIAHTENEEAAEVLKEELCTALPGYDIYVDHLPLSIACHIGPGSLAVACSTKLPIYS